jgi:YD repeat-containing protein
VSSITDPNGGTTTLVYNDSLDRLTHIDFADSSNTCYAYSNTGTSTPDGPITVSTTRDLDGAIQSLSCGSQATRNTTTSSTTDGLGRVIQTTDSAGVITAKTWDALGRVQKQFNPGDSVNVSSLLTFGPF